jgi:hypothetical protein
MRVIWVIVVLSGILRAAAPPTFYKDVLPVLERNCQSCHRAGEAAPMPLVTYKDARPWAKAMRQAVLTRKMPPWLADPAVGHFTNDRTLAPGDIETLVKWSDAGAPAGDPKDARKSGEFVDGWNIGKPDVILEMAAAYDVPASGTVEYQHFIVPTGFTEDKWVRVVELRPVRGKSFEFRVATAPQNDPQVLLRVPRYDFSWQLQYYLAEPLPLTRGSRIECLATFDNSPNNPANPDPSKEVRWGDQSWEEMMVGTVDVAIDAHMDPMDLYRPVHKRSE